MSNSTVFISTIIISLLLAFSVAQQVHAGDQAQSAETIEFGKADLKYRVDKDVDKLIGQDVVDSQGDTFGSVENMLISDPYNVQYAIISVGGFLGIGDKLVAVPVKNLHLNKDTGNVTLKNVTEEDLKNAPEFELDKSEMGADRFPEYGPEQN
jgi:hypothetical protein